MYEMLVLTKSCFLKSLCLSAHSFDFERYVLFDCIFREYYMSAFICNQHYQNITMGYE